MHPLLPPRITVDTVLLSFLFLSDLQTLYNNVCSLHFYYHTTIWFSGKDDPRLLSQSVQIVFQHIQRKKGILKGSTQIIQNFAYPIHSRAKQSSGIIILHCPCDKSRINVILQAFLQDILRFRFFMVTFFPVGQQGRIPVFPLYGQNNSIRLLPYQNDRIQRSVYLFAYPV